MLEESLFTAQVLQMGTYNPAKTLGLSNYGIKENSFADLITFDSKSIDQAIITQATKLFVIKKRKSNS